MGLGDPISFRPPSKEWRTEMQQQADAMGIPFTALVRQRVEAKSPLTAELLAIHDKQQALLDGQQAILAALAGHKPDQAADTQAAPKPAVPAASTDSALIELVLLLRAIAGEARCESVDGEISRRSLAPRSIPAALYLARSIASPERMRHAQGSLAKLGLKPWGQS